MAARAPARRRPSAWRTSGWPRWATSGTSWPRPPSTRRSASSSAAGSPTPRRWWRAWSRWPGSGRPTETRSARWPRSTRPRPRCPGRGRPALPVPALRARLALAAGNLAEAARWVRGRGLAVERRAGLSRASPSTGCSPGCCWPSTSPRPPSSCWSGGGRWRVAQGRVGERAATAGAGGAGPRRRRRPARRAGRAGRGARRSPRRRATCGCSSTRGPRSRRCCASCWSVGASSSSAAVPSRGSSSPG